MDSRIAALRAHVKERGTSNSKAGPTLTFYIRSGPVRAVPDARTYKRRRRVPTRAFARGAFGDRCRARRALPQPPRVLRSVAAAVEV